MARRRIPTSMTNDQHSIRAYLRETYPDVDPEERDALCAAVEPYEDLLFDLKYRSQEALDAALADLQFKTRNFTNADISKVEPLRLQLEEELRARLAEISRDVLAKAQARTTRAED